MITMHCEKHPDLKWSTKVQAVNINGRYTHSRGIYFESEHADECNCDSRSLLADPTDVNRSRVLAEHGDCKF